ncbi:hypothetical protein KEM54_000525 [Ascosphaera aggregata]|nr:hypothetical protein KEM54_000525 [Ascosphaera aggregata]
MWAATPTATNLGSSRKGLRSSTSIPNVASTAGVTATDGKLQASKTSLRKFNFFRLGGKVSRQFMGGQTLGSSSARDHRHIIISNPIPISDSAFGSLQNGDSYDNLVSDLATSAIDTNGSSIRQGSTPPNATPTNWEPLPLFKAYSRSIRYSTLSAPCLTAETILRSSTTQQSQSGSNGGLARINFEAQGQEFATGKKGKRRSLRSVECFSKAGWTRKIYILDTEGHMLQYAIEGSLDRLPEKILKLGSNTVAFASDAIPGKHWVIQISESVDEHNDKSATDQKKHFFGLLGHDHRHDEQKSILMVLNSPEEMGSWLESICREIERFGGKEYVCEDVIRQKRTSTVPSREGVETLFDRQDMPVNGDDSLLPGRDASTRSNSNNLHDTASYNRCSLPPRDSVDAPSLATDATDGDRVQDKFRFSYASAGTHTASSSNTSPCPSPGIVSDDQEGNDFLQLPGTKPADSEVPNHTPSEQDSLSGRLKKQTYSQSPNVSKSPPNFSVPVFSKRYSAQTPRNSMMSQSMSNASHSSSINPATQQIHEQRDPPITTDPSPRQPLRQRATSASVTESRLDAARLLSSPTDYKEQCVAKGYSTGSGICQMSGNLRPFLNGKERKASAPPLVMSQGYKFYNKPPPHIPETLDEDPINQPNSTDQARWPTPNSIYLGTPFSNNTRRSSWGNTTSRHGLIDAVLNSTTDEITLPKSPSVPSDVPKRASWAALETPRSGIIDADPPPRRPSSSFPTGTGPSEPPLPPSKMRSVSNSYSYRLKDDPSSERFASNQLVRSRSMQFMSLGPPAPPPDCPLPGVPKRMQAAIGLPPAPPPCAPLPVTPSTAAHNPGLRGGSPRATLEARRRSGQSTFSRSSIDILEVAKDRKATTINEPLAVPLIIPPGAGDKITESDEIRAKQVSMYNAF